MTFSLPDEAKIVGGDFRLVSLGNVSGVPTAQYQGEPLGESLWYARIETTALSRAQANDYKWRLARLRGKQETIYVYDASRPRPLAFDPAPPYLDAPTCDSTMVTCDTDWIGCDAVGDGVIPPWGSPRVVAIDYETGDADFAGFYPGSTITEGDYGALNDGAKRRLWIFGGGVAGADGAMTMGVAPIPFAALSTLPIRVALEKPCAEMRLMESTVNFSAPSTSMASMDFVQTLRSE